MRNYNNAILKEYEKIRDKNKLALIERKKEVFKHIPRLRDIEDELKTLGLDLSRVILKSPQKAADAAYIIEDKVNALKNEKAFLLTENNLPITYLELKYDCDKCNDTGFTENAKFCNCYKQKKINRSYGMSNISHLLEKENFKTFNIDLFSADKYENEELSPRDNMKEILMETESFVHNFDNIKQPNLLFYGNTGLGKTFLCNCIAKALLDKEKLVVYQTSFKILEILQDYKFGNKSNQEVRDNYQLLFDCDLLIIDDLGTELNNSFTNSEIFNIVNTRMLDNKKVVISTNLTPEEFSSIYGDRVYSRVLGTYEILKFYGNDIRWL